MKAPGSSSLRFALAISASFALAALVAGGISYALQTGDLSRRLESDVTRLAQSMARTADPQDLHEQIMAQIAAQPDGALIVAWRSADGAATLGNVDIADRFLGARHLVTGTDLRLLTPPDSQAPEGYYAYAVTTSGGWLMVGRDDAWVTDTREILLQTTEWGLGVGLLLSVMLALAIAWRNESRIARIQGVLDAVGAGDHTRRIGETGADDLARVAREVDATLDRLEAGIAAIRQVSTDVAHDLRAPLSRLRIRLEGILSAPSTGTEAELAKALAEVDGISDTFDAILRLARLQSATVPLEATPLDLHGILHEVAELFDASGDETGHQVSVASGIGPVPFLGDRELLIQALVNLVDNALRHSPPGPVSLALHVEHGHAVLSVADRGPGIALQDRDRAVQRFGRLDRSRSTPGTGLGLAIVAAIAALHHGTLHLEDNAPGLRAVIDLPLAP